MPALFCCPRQVPRYLPYLRLLFSAMDHMPKVDNVLWRGIAADLYDTYEEGKVRPRSRGPRRSGSARWLGICPRVKNLRLPM